MKNLNYFLKHDLKSHDHENELNLKLRLDLPAALGVGASALFVVVLALLRVQEVVVPSVVFVMCCGVTSKVQVEKNHNPSTEHG